MSRRTKISAMRSSIQKSTTDLVVFHWVHRDKEPPAFEGSTRTRERLQHVARNFTWTAFNPPTICPQEMRTVGESQLQRSVEENKYYVMRSMIILLAQEKNSVSTGTDSIVKWEEFVLYQNRALEKGWQNGFRTGPTVLIYAFKEKMLFVSHFGHANSQCHLPVVK